MTMLSTSCHDHKLPSMSLEHTIFTFVVSFTMHMHNLHYLVNAVKNEMPIISYYKLISGRNLNFFNVGNYVKKLQASGINFLGEMGL